MIPRPPNWKGQTVVCIGSGPSLTAADCDLVRAAGVPVVVTNTTFRLCPWADALMGFDSDWWRMHIAEVRATFKGRLFCHSSWGEIHGIEGAGDYPDWHSFGNCGANAVALAIVSGAAAVVLLGFDGQATGGRLHHHEDHPAPLRNCDTMPKWEARFRRLAGWAAARRVPIVNASRETVVRAFARAALEDCLPAPPIIGTQTSPGCRAYVGDPRCTFPVRAAT